MTISIGNASKDSRYLVRIKAAISLDPTHPRHHGIKMQAHHIISGKGMELSRLGKQIEKFGYDINLLPNLSFLPCTLQGACHLGVQLHRGNHTTPVSQDEYDDDEGPRNYHQMVAIKIQRLNLPIREECPGNDRTRSNTVVEALDNLSKQILDLIQDKPDEAPLTDIATSFLPGNTGCGGTDSIQLHKIHQLCSVGRNHMNQQGANQKNEGISYKSDGKYRLTPGR